MDDPQYRSAHLCVGHSGRVLHDSCALSGTLRCPASTGNSGFGHWYLADFLLTGATGAADTCRTICDAGDGDDSKWRK